MLVIELAMPNPCGTISNHKWNADVLSVHKTTRTFARTVSREDTKVKVYSFPVFLMTLEKSVNITKEMSSSDCSPAGKHAPGTECHLKT